MRCSAASALALLALLATPSTAHSWVQQMSVFSPSTLLFVGKYGYARSNYNQTLPGFTDLDMVHILPTGGAPTLEQRALDMRQAAPSIADNITANTADPVTAVDTMGILPTDPMCKKLQQNPTQIAGSPRLQAVAGDMIALQYQENGHVTLPANQPGKQPNRGTVYIYGTTQPKFPEIFLDVFLKWNSDGTGGDKRGKLLGSRNFDDGRCYQQNQGEISSQRQKLYPKIADATGSNLWCQNDIQIPADAPSGKPYTIYWVWDWPTLPGGDPGLPKGKAEIYTTCMDVDITTGTKVARDLEVRAAPASAPGPSQIASMAIAAQVSQIMSPPSAAQASAAPPVSSPAAQAAPSVSSAPAAAAPAAPMASAPSAAPTAPMVSTPAASPAAAVASTPAAVPAAAAATPAVNGALLASEKVVASQILAYISQAVASEYPSAVGLLKSGVPQGALAAPVTVTVTVSGAAAGAANAAAGSVPTSTATVLSTMQTVYAASTPVVAGAQAPSQAPAAAAPVASSPAAAAAAPVASAGPSIPPSSIALAAPVLSGAAPASPAAAVASSPAAAPASVEAGSPPMASSVTAQAAPAGAASTAQALANAETASAPLPSAPTSAAAAPAVSSSPKIGTFTGTATPAAATMASASTNGTTPAVGKRSCANKACKKVKRSMILPQK